MKLDNSQLEEIKKWISAGADVPQVQKQILEQFGLSMKYMDVRFLIDDLEVELNIPEPPKPQPKVEENPMPSQADSFDSNLLDESNKEALLSNKDFEEYLNGTQNSTSSESQNSADDSVIVAMNPIKRAGAFANGSVIFSDGVSAEWVLDENGQLGLIAQEQGYNPPSQDLPIFQKKLQELLGFDNKEDNSTYEEYQQSKDPNKKPIEVTMSKIQRPDSLAFGDVVFSDGSKAEWRIDQMGQLNLIPEDTSKKPPQEDMLEFQHKLQDLLKSMY